MCRRTRRRCAIGSIVHAFHTPQYPVAGAYPQVQSQSSQSAVFVADPMRQVYIPTSAAYPPQTPAMDKDVAPPRLATLHACCDKFMHVTDHDLRCLGPVAVCRLSNGVAAYYSTSEPPVGTSYSQQVRKSFHSVKLIVPAAVSASTGGSTRWTGSSIILHHLPFTHR